MVAKNLLGKVIRHKYENQWLSAQIIETESYYLHEKGSHASLGYTDSRKALFMPPGTIYMYYARGGDSLNIICKGKGNAVLIKSGIPYQNSINYDKIIEIMQKNNPIKNNGNLREPMKLCSGQTLLCKSLGIKVTEWNKHQFNNNLYIENVDYFPSIIVNAKRLGIPKGRDEHLLYRFIDFKKIKYCTKNPLLVRNNKENKDFLILKNA